MVIQCPHCGHQGKVDVSRIPSKGANAKCPSCRGSFPVRRSEIPQQQTGGHKAPSPEPEPSIPPVQKSPAASVATGQPTEQMKDTSPSADPPPVPSEPVLRFQDEPPPVPGQTQQPAGGEGFGFKDPLPHTVKTKSAACTGCLNLFNEGELAQSGERKLCPSCVEAFKQKGQTPNQGRVARRATPNASAKKRNFVYGGFWIRFGAYLVDGMLLFLIWHFLLSPVLLKVGMSMFSQTALPAVMSLPQDDSVDPAQMESALAQMQEAMDRVSNRMILWIWAVQLIGLILTGGYFIVLEGGPGQTVGKKALGLRVVSKEGDPIGYLKAFARCVGKMLSGLILCIGFVMAAFDEEKRALHDRMVDSRVVRV